MVNKFFPNFQVNDKNEYLVLSQFYIDTKLLHFKSIFYCNNSLQTQRQTRYFEFFDCFFFIKRVILWPIKQKLFFLLNSSNIIIFSYENLEQRHKFLAEHNGVRWFRFSAQPRYYKMLIDIYLNMFANQVSLKYMFAIGCKTCLEK